MYDSVYKVYKKNQTIFMSHNPYIYLNPISFFFLKYYYYKALKIIFSCFNLLIRIIHYLIKIPHYSNLI